MNKSLTFSKYLFSFFSLSILFFSLSIYSLKMGFKADPQISQKLFERYNILLDFDGLTMPIPGDSKFARQKDWLLPAHTKKILIKSLSATYTLRQKSEDDIKVSVTGFKPSNDANDLLKVEGSDQEVTLTEPSEDIVSNLKVLIEIPVRFKGTIEFYTRNGNFSAENLKLDGLFMRTISGDILLKNISAQMIEYETTSGDLKSFESKIERLKTKTISGNIEIENEIPLNASLDSVSGDVKLHFKTEQDIQFHIKSVSGNIDNEIGSDKNSKNVIEISTISGDILINK